MSKQLFEAVMLDITLLVHVVGKHNVPGFHSNPEIQVVFRIRVKNKNKKKTFFSSSYFESVIYLLQQRFLRDSNHFCICYIRCGYNPIPHRPRLPRIATNQFDKYLDSWLNRTQFVKILSESHSP